MPSAPSRLFRKLLTGHGPARRKACLSATALLGSLAAGALFLDCGGSGGGSGSTPPQMPGAAAFTPTSVPLGNVNLSCGKNQQNQQAQQVTFQQQQQSASPSCQPQLEFYNSQVTNLDVNLDCADRAVWAKPHDSGGPYEQFPIPQTGVIQGSFQYQQQVQNDGHGDSGCVVTTTVTFNGVASCYRPGSSRHDNLQLATQVQFDAPPSESGSASLRAGAPSSDPGLVADGTDNPTSAPPFFLSQPTSSPALTPPPLFPPASAPTVNPAPTLSATPVPSSSPQACFSPLPVASPSPSPSPSASPTPSPEGTSLMSPSPSPSPSPSGLAPLPSPLPTDEVTVAIPSGTAQNGCGNGAPVVVRPNTVVTWINQDSQPHTVTADDGTFDSGTMLPGTQFSYVANQRGNFRYHSTLDSGVRGLLIVTGVPWPGSSPSPAPSPSMSPAPSPAGSPAPGPSVIPTPIPAPPFLAPGNGGNPAPEPPPSQQPGAELPPPQSQPPYPPALPPPSNPIEPLPPPPNPSSTSVTQVVQCVVTNPCPVVAKTSYSCDSQQQQATSP